VPTGEAHWHLLLRARAVESQAYILAAAQVGDHSDKRKSYGHALAVDPWGKVLADAGLESPSIVTVDIDPALIASIKTRMPIQTHRRQDVLDLL
jgi:predicted amidohydrolase